MKYESQLSILFPNVIKLKDTTEMTMRSYTDITFISRQIWLHDKNNCKLWQTLDSPSIVIWQTWPVVLNACLPAYCWFHDLSCQSVPYSQHTGIVRANYIYFIERLEEKKKCTFDHCSCIMHAMLVAIKGILSGWWSTFEDDK